MVVVELSNPTELNTLAPYEPFIYKASIDGYTLEDFWVDTFGFPDESRTDAVTVVTEVSQGFNDPYTKVNSIDDLRLLEESFYYDMVNQDLYIHMPSNTSPLIEDFYYSTVEGFTDNRLIYVDNLEYNSLIKSIPSIAQKQDIENYDRPAYMSGSIVMRNNGELDYLFDRDVVGNTIKLYYLDDSKVNNKGDEATSVATLEDISTFSPYSPFVYTSKPGAFTLADFWTDTFGFPDDSVTTAIDVKAFIRSNQATYTPVLSLANCQNLEGSFYWDTFNQTLYVHFEHEHNPFSDTYQFSQDAVGSGNPDTVSRVFLQPLAEFYIDDFKASQKEYTFKVQDKRKADTTQIPNIFFTNEGQYKDQPVPVLIGPVREATAYPTNDTVLTGNVDYRICNFMTDLGTIYVLIDNVWTEVTPVSSDITTGVFTLSDTDGRDSSGAVRFCKSVNPIGYAVTYGSDIIKVLNEEFLDIPFTSTFYDTSEWTSEESSLPVAGILIERETEISDIIYEVTKEGFRYEILRDGRRTIRLNDNDRASDGLIDNVDMANRDLMPIFSDSDLQFSTVTIKYAKSYQSGRFFREKDSTFETSINSRNKNRSDYSVETLLFNQSDAIARAASDAERFKDVPLYVDLILSDVEYLFLRIFDIRDLTLIPGFSDFDNLTYQGRKYLGFKKGKVVRIDPNVRTLKNKVRFQLL